jgi:hypothetical protein
MELMHEIPMGCLLQEDLIPNLERMIFEPFVEVALAGVGHELRTCWCSLDVEMIFVRPFVCVPCRCYLMRAGDLSSCAIDCDLD